MGKSKHADAMEGLAIISKQVSPIVFETIKALVMVNPVWTVLFHTAFGIFNAWGEFGQNRVNELVKFIAEHKDEFVAEVLKSDKFKAVFLNVLEMHMKETGEKKRQLLRNYLLATGKGIVPDFDEHTKIISTLHTVTLEELRILEWFGSGGPIFEHERANPNQRPAYYDLHQINHFLMVSGNKDLLLPIQGGNRTMSDKYNQILMSLGYQGLLWVTSSDGFGSGVEAKVKGITEFGKTFLAFIKEPDSN